MPVALAAVSTAVGVSRDAEGSVVVASVEDHYRTTTTTIAGESSCSRTSMIPTTVGRTILATSTTRTATRIRLTNAPQYCD